MSDMKDQEQMRDTIASMLELSRDSWKTTRNQNTAIKAEDDENFPRSILFKALQQHPLLSIAAVASIWYMGPARFGAMAVAGASLFIRHRSSILPIAQQIIGSSIFKAKDEKPEAQP